MSNYNERNSRASDRLTVAGIAAVIVVAVFVVCVILILAKSLFPSNEPEVTDDVYTGTKSDSSFAAPAVESATDLTESVSSFADTSSVTDSTDPLSSDSDSSSDSSSVSDLGETATLSQTAYLRSAGNENAEPLFSINAGEQVTVLERPSDSEYVKVRYYENEGWVWNGYLY